MEAWIATTNDSPMDAPPIGVYTTEELALAAAERVSPGESNAELFVLDEVPDWIDTLEREERLFGGDQE
ncbi:MAG: hypothetical protein WBV77_08535 [Solirubrobacteraceae bacterium]